MTDQIVFQLISVCHLGSVILAVKTPLFKSKMWQKGLKIKIIFPFNLKHLLCNLKKSLEYSLMSKKDKNVCLQYCLQKRA